MDSDNATPEKLTPKEIKAEKLMDMLAQCSGTESYHRISSVIPKTVVTDGILHLAEEGQCFWAITDAAIILSGRAEVKRELYNRGILVRICNKSGTRRKIQYMDLNRVLLYAQYYDLMDFPFPEFEFYAMPGEDNLCVIMLKGEY